jgi:hypothetical protein
VAARSLTEELPRSETRMTITLTQRSSQAPPPEVIRSVASWCSDGSTRLLWLDSTNPHGGTGGSVASEHCAWLVRQLASHSGIPIVVSTRHRSLELHNDAVPHGESPRVLGPELAAILMAHENVVGWVAGNRHPPQTIRHGSALHVLWELTPAMTGLGWRRWMTAALGRSSRVLAFDGRATLPAQYI